MISFIPIYSWLFTSFTLIPFFIYGQTPDDIRLNQIGFLTNAQKIAVINIEDATNFEIASADLSTIFFEGELSEGMTWDQSGETVKVADFSAFNIPGEYVVSIPDIVQSAPFIINNTWTTPLSIAVLKAFYFHRASTALSEEFAGPWQRPAGHPDTEVIVHASAASPERPAGTIISTPRGWYDAGDYNKYIVNSGISTYSVLAAYEQFSQYYDTLYTNIPESGNDIPDILDEALWNVRWMLTMQDPNDGGVYNKTTNANFDGMVMPHLTTTARYVVAKGTAAALDFCAVTAVMGRIAKKFEAQLPGLADSCLVASVKAWEWAIANPNVRFRNPGQTIANGVTYPAVVTGEYGDNTFTDEKSWAAAELYITTKEDAYYNLTGVASATYAIPGWPNVNTLGLLSLARHRKTLTSVADTTVILNKLLTLADEIKDEQKESSPYRIPEVGYYWGTNANFCNAGMITLQAFEATKNVDYYNTALSALDNLLGRNATTYSFITGFGTKRVMNPHQRQSVGDDIAEPIPGWLSGGPHNDGGDNCPRGQFPATSFLDLDSCYALNEVAINWNAPLVFLTAGIDVYKPSGTVTSVNHGNWENGSNLNVFPNPSSENFNLSLNSAIGGKFDITITDLWGKEVGTFLNQNTNEVISIDNRLAPGVYQVKVNYNNAEVTRKIVKMP